MKAKRSEKVLIVSSIARRLVGLLIATMLSEGGPGAYSSLPMFDDIDWFVKLALMRYASVS